MTKLRGLYFLIIIFFLASGVFSQTRINDDAKWTRVEDSKFQVSLLFPSNYLVDNEEIKSPIITPVVGEFPKFIEYRRKPYIIGFHRSVRMSISVCQLIQVPAAKQYLWFFVSPDTPKDKYEEFQLGDVLGRKTLYDKDDALAINIAFAVKSRIYLINASAKKEDKEIYEKFITSLMINGTFLFKGQTPETTNTAQTVAISTLQTSPEILEALNQKPGKDDGEVEKLTPGSSTEDDEDERKFSRPVYILRQPFPSFPSPIGRKRKSGSVKLKISFLASGKIGKIIVLFGAPDSYVEAAVKAARGIKFLPAEIDEKKADAIKTREYQFIIDK